MSMISREALRRRTHSRGFSLIELAIGLVIVATLLSALLVPLATQMDQQRAAETKQLVQAARDALIGYAISEGRLPCPASDDSNGVEAFVLSTGNPGNGDCEASTGFLPGVTLGLSPLDGKGYFRDAYGTASNRIRYAVSEANVNKYTNSIDCATRGAGPVAEPRPLTSSGGMRRATMQMISQAASCDQLFLKVCTMYQCSGAGNQTLANGSAVVVVWSVGRNAADTGRLTPNDENENLNGDSVFVARERRDRKDDSTDNEFDDYVLWISPSVLLGRMAAAGALP